MQFDRIVESVLEETAIMEPPRRGRIRNTNVPPIEDEEVGDYNDSRVFAIVATPKDSYGNAVLEIMGFERYNYGDPDSTHPRIILLHKNNLKQLIDQVSGKVIKLRTDSGRQEDIDAITQRYYNKVDLKVWPVTRSVTSIDSLREENPNEEVIIIYKTGKKIRNHLEYSTYYPNFIKTTAGEFIKNYNTNTSLYTGTGMMNEPRYNNTNLSPLSPPSNRPITFIKAAVLGPMINRPLDWI